MKKNIITILLILFYNLIFSQVKNKTDSLIIQANLCKDANKEVNIYIELTDILTNTNPDSAIYFCNKGIKISMDKKFNNKLKILYKNLGRLYSIKGNYSKSAYFFETGLYYAKNKTDTLDFYTSLASVKTLSGDLNSALDIIEKISKFYIKQEITQKNLTLLITKGVIYYRKGWNIKAAKQYLNILENFEDSLSNKTKGILYQNLGSVFAIQKRYKKAENYYRKAKKLYLTGNEEIKTCKIYINLGILNVQIKKFNIAENYLDSAITISDKLHLSSEKATILFTYGQIYSSKKRLNKALSFYKKSLKIREKNNIAFESVFNYNAIASCYLNMNNLILSEKYAKQSLKKAKKRNTSILIADAYSLLSRIYKKQKKFKNAYSYLDSFKTRSDSIFEINKTKIVSELEVIYQAEKNEKEIQKLTFQSKINTKEIKQKQRTIILIIIISILIIIPLIIFQRYKRQKNRTINKLKIINSGIEAEEKIKDEIARELHDDIGGKLVTVLNNIKEKTVRQSVENIYNDVRSLSHSLSDPLFIDINLSEKIQDLIYKTEKKNLIKIHFFDYLNYDWKNIDNNQKIQKALYRIIQELTTNTIKHAKATEIELQLVDSEKNIILSYNDNGIGFDNIRKKEGIGLENIKKRTGLLLGSFHIDSFENKGVSVIIQIPISIKISDKTN